MQVSLEEFKDFYKDSAGKLALKIICEHLNNDFKNNEGQRILGFGFTRPFLERLSSPPICNVNFLPIFGDESAPDLNGLGQAIRPDLIGEAHYLPFADLSFDKIFCIHSIEESEKPKQVLRELWRVLAPEGRIIIIVPNRRGIWSRSDKTPFWHGRPYSKSQFTKLIGDTMFNIKSANRILFTPPAMGATHNALINGFEQFGDKFFRAFGGLLYFELEKRQFIEPPRVNSPLRLLETQTSSN